MEKPLIETFQNEWELLQLLRVFNALNPSRVLEIGAWHGGTLWHWLQSADHVVVVDDGMRRSMDWEQWAIESPADLTMVRGMSYEAHVIQKVEDLGPYDFIFIDGDHSYWSVRQDWDNYSHLATRGGIIVLHDILPRPGYGVSQLWEEITSIPGARYMTICANEIAPGNEGRCGIGLVFV